MRRIQSALAPRNSARWNFACRKDRPPGVHSGKRANTYAIFVTAAALSLISDCAFGQTTRSGPSSSSTSKTIPSTSSTSPNSPCNPTNPNSPCYSANAPRNPCYSAAAPNEPCSTTITPNSRTSPASSPPAATTPKAAVRAFTQDQAKSQIEAKGYLRASGLQKDANGTWHGKAEKDGLPVNVILDVRGNVIAN
jgi:periplasmic protein CpxP/Spy